MRLSRSALAVLALALLGPALLVAQEPLAAGSEGVPVPKKKKHVQPTYPPDALAQGIRGIVILDLVIDTEGRVAETNIIRSIPGLDEAALAAVSQWTYEPVEVDGKPVSVRLTVPITFALKLPQMTRQPGIPPLRQGVTPPWPESSPGGGRAVADITLEPDGRIGLARILEGEDPWSTALLQALRTWRFSTPPDDATVSFQVAAEFVPGRGRDGDRTVRLDLRSLRETALLDAPEEPAAEEPVQTARMMPVPESTARPPENTEPPPGSDVDATRPAAPPPAEEATPPPPHNDEKTPVAVADTAGASAPAPAPPAPEEAAGPPPEAAPAPEAEPAPTVETRAPSTPQTASPPAPAAPASGSSPAAPPAAPADLALARPAEGSGETPAPPDLAAAGTPPAAALDPTAPPPVETLSVAPPPLPPENGISAIRGVELEPGVPDLTRGRRPVSPPLARMVGAGGVVQVDFSVSAGGIPTIQRTDGPDILLPAASSAVESWVFRRTRADRAYLTAVFTYEDDLATAVVRPQPRRDP